MRYSRRVFLQSSIALAGFSDRFSGRRLARGPSVSDRGLSPGLREHGYVEGKTILIEYRFSEDRNERLPTLATELLALTVRIILASGTPASFATNHATTPC
jgi:hypothetical protein